MGRVGKGRKTMITRKSRRQSGNRDRRRSIAERAITQERRRDAAKKNVPEGRADRLETHALTWRRQKRFTVMIQFPRGKVHSCGGKPSIKNRVNHRSTTGEVEKLRRRPGAREAL